MSYKAIPRPSFQNDSLPAAATLSNHNIPASIYSLQPQLDLSSSAIPEPSNRSSKRKLSSAIPLNISTKTNLALSTHVIPALHKNFLPSSKKFKQTASRKNPSSNILSNSSPIKFYSSSLSSTTCKITKTASIDNTFLLNSFSSNSQSSNSLYQQSLIPSASTLLSLKIGISLSNPPSLVYNIPSNNHNLPNSISYLHPLSSAAKLPLSKFSYLDQEDSADPLMVSEYISDIIQYLLENEKKNMPDPNYIAKQPEISWQMRKALVNWVIKVHYHFQMFPETLFLAINLIDRFLSKRFVAANKLQLVGLVSLFIASKYEEMSTKPIADFLLVANSTYSEKDFLTAERFLLRVIDYNLSFCGPLTFLRRVSKADNYNLKNRTLAKYFMEISLVDHSFLPFPPSLIAAASFYTARLLSDVNEWSPIFSFLSSYSLHQLLPCVNAFVRYLVNTPASSKDTLTLKYSQKCYYYASSISQKWAAQLSSPKHLSCPSILPISCTCLSCIRPNCNINSASHNCFYPQNTTSIQKSTSRSSHPDDITSPCF
ncbi:hypothetical protein BB561_001849 [Smittium simulii]|uniref:Uncharacterized protein n=1 Tax=Smittium simulii TaxID=133385 RepID=A0A2T9YSZ3_9FUNG|nr:hypothetical protein BB561_001849 [Smittium simulii]